MHGGGGEGRGKNKSDEFREDVEACPAPVISSLPRVRLHRPSAVLTLRLKKMAFLPRTPARAGRRPRALLTTRVCIKL